MRNESVLGRESPRHATKEDLARRVGNYVLTAATMASKSLNDNAFVPTSKLQASIGDIVSWMGNIAGGGVISAPLAVSLTRTPTGYEKQFLVHQGSQDGMPNSEMLAPVSVKPKTTVGGYEIEFSYDQRNAKKPRRSSVQDMEWPMSPVDCLSFLIFQLWPDELEVIGEPDQKSAWENMITKWWNSLGESIRRLLMTTHQELALESDHMDTSLDGYNSINIPIKSLKEIVEFSHTFFRGKIANIIWRDLDPALRDAIFKAYKQKSSYFTDMLRKEYLSVYVDTEPEHCAKVLLDIFLEVEPDRHYTSTSEMTDEYCNTLLETMEGAMNRWNELVALVKSNDNVLWDPDSIDELDQLVTKFGGTEMIYEQKHPAQEFSTSFMVKRFLYQQLSSKSDVPDCGALREKMQKMVKEMKKVTEQAGPSIESEMIDMEQVLNEYRIYSAHVHAR